MDIKEIQRKAKYFKRLFRQQFKNTISINQDADDFEQFCIESMLRRESEDLNYKWISIDFLRSPQSSRYDYKRSSLSPDSPSIPAQKQELFLLLPQLKLHKTDRMILVLMLKWGLTGREVGEVFDWDESYVSQRLRSLKQDLKQKLIEADFLD